ESTVGHNKYCLSEEEISRRRRLRHQFFRHTSDEEEDDEEEEEEKKEQEWTLERIKYYYDRGIQDHIDCEDAEEQRQLQYGFYYKVVGFSVSKCEVQPGAEPGIHVKGGRKHGRCRAFLCLQRARKRCL
ncbi:hypothetical protein Tco_1306727, partial [Tanacetum coccineum]